MSNLSDQDKLWIVFQDVPETNAREALACIGSVGELYGKEWIVLDGEVSSEVYVGRVTHSGRFTIIRYCDNNEVVLSVIKGQKTEIHSRFDLAGMVVSLKAVVRVPDFVSE